jgi:hypothetical protein
MEKKPHQKGKQLPEYYAAYFLSFCLAKHGGRDITEACYNILASVGDPAE